MPPIMLLSRCFKVSYFWISSPNSCIEWDEWGILSKGPHWNLFVFLNIKIKRNSGCLDEEYNAIFLHIHQNNSAYFRSKKTALINDWENIGYWEESDQNEFGLFRIQIFTLV